ncbi:MAG: Opr family porin [Arcobacteraceae bacterium]
MKKISLSIAAIATMTMMSSLSANTLSEALINGKVTGDLSVTYEVRDVKKDISTYYQDTAYSMGSVALGYKTDTFYNFGVNVGFRAYKALYQDDSNKLTWKGTGDASERFYETRHNRNIDIETAHISYDLENLHIKAGRQYLSTEWVDKTHDAVSLYSSLNDTDIEFIWTSKHGRITNRDYRPMEQVNPGNGGLYKLGITQNFNENISAKAYGVTAPSLQDIYGGKLEFKNSVNSIDYGALAHYAQTNEDVNDVKNSNVLELKTFATIAGYTATLGFVKIDKDAAFNYHAGETINPMEEGDQLFVKDAKTTYLMLSKDVFDVNLTALYGITKYQEFKKSEFNLWAAYELVKDLNLNLGYALTNEDNKDPSTTNLNQFNATIAYVF